MKKGAEGGNFRDEQRPHQIFRNRLKITRNAFKNAMPQLEQNFGGGENRILRWTNPIHSGQNGPLSIVVPRGKFSFVEQLTLTSPMAAAL